MSADGSRGPAEGLVAVALAHRLTLVVAPPGWGKSTLLRAWAAEAPAIEIARPPTGWTPFALARDLLDAVTVHTGASTTGEFPAHAAPDSPDGSAHVAALAAAVCAAAKQVIRRPTLVLLDDVEVAGGSPMEGFLDSLVLHLPGQLHLVLACRRTPAMRLGRLRASGAVAQLATVDLALTRADVDALGLLPGAAAAVTEILEASGGWPLAVHLAAEAVRGLHDSASRAELVDRLLAPSAVLHAYLAEEVLAGLDDGDRDLLAIAAHVPYVSAPLLVRLGRDDLVDHLADLAAGQLFLEPDPSAPSRWRVDLLGGEFARRVLPPPPAELLAGAVDALLANGDVEHAVVLGTTLGDAAVAMRIAVAVDRPHRLAAPGALLELLQLAETAGAHPRLAELHGDLQFMSGDWDHALSSYARALALGDPASPRLCRKRGVILYLRGRLEEAEAACVAARLDGQDPGEEAQVLAWRAAMRWMRSDIAGCEALVAQATALAARSSDDAALATIHTTNAMLAALRSDRPANVRSYRLALKHAQRADDVVQIARIRSNMGSHHLEEGAYHDALRELDAAIEVAELAGSETFTALAYANRGETNMRMGRLDDARRDLLHAQQVWERLGSDLVDYALGQLAMTQLLRGQRAEARAMFTRTVELAEQRDDAQSLAPALIGLARVLMDEDLDAAAAAARRAIDAGHVLWKPQAVVVAGWVALKRGDRDAARRYAAQARRLAEGQRDRPAVAELLLLEAAAGQPPSRAIAAEAGQLWRDLGNPIGQARAAMLVAETATGAERADLLASAEQLLYEAGAWGYLEELRRVASNVAEVTITTLGGFRVSRGGQLIEPGQWGSRKARDLVKLLVARRGAPVVRDEAAELLWPDEPDRSAKRLSVLLSTIRTVMDPTKRHPSDRYVAADHDTVWLVRENLDIDVEQFLDEVTDGRRLVASGNVDKGEALLAQAVARYLGPFCADDPYADWTAGTRELARHTFVDASRQLSALAAARGAPGEAVLHHLRILDVDPYDEVAHLALVRALTAQRRHGEARRAYRTYCDRLAELDLDAAPFPA